jgi:phosphate transport system substrate-binding protein
LGLDYEWVGSQQRFPGWDPRAARAEAEFRLLEYTLQPKWSTAVEDRLARIITGLLAANASTHEAYMSLITATADIGLLARPPSPSESEAAKTQGVILEVAPCALDAFVFLINSQNSTNNLTTDQIRAVYSQRISDWSQVGGKAGGITAYQREDNSGSQELMRTLVMKEVPLYKPTEPYSRAPQLIGSLMSSVYLELSSDPSGIGYSVYYYEHYMTGGSRTKMIAVDGVEPTFETIRDRKYPYTCEVFVVTRKGLEPEAPARKLRDWLRSAEGQAVVRESGYVPSTGVQR